MTSEGETFFDSIFIEVLPLPEVDLGADTSFCGGVVTTLNAGNDGVKYLWSTGDTSKTILVDTSTLFSGYGERILWVNVYNSNQCVKRDTISVTFVNCTGIEEHENNLSLNVYPNPGKGDFNILLNALEDDVVDVMVISQAGVILYNKKHVPINTGRGII